MDMQYVRHDTHKSNSQAQTGNDSGSEHNTDSGAYGSTTHIRHSHAEGYAYGSTTHICHSYTEGLAHGFTAHIRHGTPRPRQQHHLMRRLGLARVFRLRLHPAPSISGTADSDGKNGDRGEKSGFGENAVGKDVPQKNEKNNVQAAERSFSVGTILVFTLVPTLLIVAVVVFLLVWRKKKRQV